MNHVHAAEAAVDWEYDWDTIEVVDSEPDLDADPERDNAVTPGFSVRLHRSGDWAVCIHGEFHKRFRDHGAAAAYCRMAEMDWAEMFDPNAGDAFGGHPVQEGGAE